jgi:hypothetical protein
MLGLIEDEVALEICYPCFDSFDCSASILVKRGEKTDTIFFVYLRNFPRNVVGKPGDIQSSSDESFCNNLKAHGQVFFETVVLREMRNASSRNRRRVSCSQPCKTEIAARASTEQLLLIVALKRSQQARVIFVCQTRCRSTISSPNVRKMFIEPSICELLSKWATFKNLIFFQQTTKSFFFSSHLLTNGSVFFKREWFQLRFSLQGQPAEINLSFAQGSSHLNADRSLKAVLQMVIVSHQKRCSGSLAQL